MPPVEDLIQLIERAIEPVQRLRRCLRLSWQGLVLVMVALAGAIGAAVVLSAVSEDVVAGNGLELHDASNLQLVTDHRSGLLISLARLGSELGSVGVLALIAIAAGVFLWYRGARLVLALAPQTALAAAGLAASIGKQLVGRSRPPVGLRLVTETEASFPSGHATDSTALLLTVGLLLAAVVFHRPLLRVLSVASAGLLALGIGASRLVLGVHWPTDVFAGWALGIIVGLSVTTVGVLIANHPPEQPTAEQRKHLLLAKLQRLLATIRHLVGAPPSDLQPVAVLDRDPVNR